jgi:dTDP-4-dehydrorhamnose 3,5-epimerase-like enzyme
MPDPITPLSPHECTIDGVVVVERTIHFDGRGFLVEALRVDDEAVLGHDFQMTYTSLSVPGAARDADRWHHHRFQQDRYLIATGQMLMAFYDPRPSSPSYGRLEVLLAAGASEAQVAQASSTGVRFDVPTYMVMIPIGVYHSFKNAGSEGSILQNFPTRLYDPTDEGRALFSETAIPALGSMPFSWEMVARG